MIEYIKGELTEITPAMAVIECNGLGYGINVSLNTYSAIQGKKEVKLYIYESIREDAYILYGFATKQERELFLLLISVSGIGGKRSIPRKIAGDSGEVAVKIMRSYEWVRYASLPDLRISGGMGRLFSAFVRDVAPDDVMSYADLEWSDGDVYAKLGFVEAGYRKPVDFAVNFSTYSRVPLKYASNDAEHACDLRNSVVIRNLGSKKYLWTNPEKTSGTVLVEKNFGIW